MTETEHVMEFDLPVPLKNDDLFQPHVRLRNWILDNCPSSDISAPLSHYAFLTVCALCDPYTQPEDTEEAALSVDRIADVAIALCYQRYCVDSSSSVPPPLASVKFALSLRFFEVLEALGYCLNLSDAPLPSDSASWEESYRFWEPRIPDDDDVIKLCYYMTCVLVMTLYKLFVPLLPESETSANPPSANLALNPYAAYLTKLWHCYTNVLSVALHYDRRLEEDLVSAEDGYFDTPNEIKMVLLGSSAVRGVLAYVLNSSFSLHLPLPNLRSIAAAHSLDLTTLPLLDFYDPLARRHAMAGSLIVDLPQLMPLYLVLRALTTWPASSPETAVAPRGDIPDPSRVYVHCARLASVLFPFDQLDGDVKYVFGYFDSDDDSDGGDSDHENDSNTISAPSTDFPMALRSDADSIDFDDHGRDWRDCVRGANVDFSPDFLARAARYDALKTKDDSDDFFADWDVFHKILVFTASLVTTPTESGLAQTIINTVAKAVKDEGTPMANDISPNAIYSFLVSPVPHEPLNDLKLFLVSYRRVTYFELILKFNPTIAHGILDELLMCPGYRRPLIWFLTHSLNIHMPLVDYIYDLVSGNRGPSAKSDIHLRFSRCGSTVEISPVEKLMLLHEFIVNATAWFVQGALDADAQLPDTNARKLVYYICLMLAELIHNNIIALNPDHDDDFDNYNHDLQVFLFPWVGKVPLARKLFFLTRQPHDDAAPDSAPDAVPDAPDADVSIDNSIDNSTDILPAQDAVDAAQTIQNIQNGLAEDFGLLDLTDDAETENGPSTEETLVLVAKNQSRDEVVQFMKANKEAGQTVARLALRIRSYIIRFQGLPSAVRDMPMPDPLRYAKDLRLFHEYFVVLNHAFSGFRSLRDMLDLQQMAYLVIFGGDDEKVEDTRSGEEEKDNEQSVKIKTVKAKNQKKEKKKLKKLTKDKKR